MKTEIYDITGMHCSACSSAIERITRKMAGVETSDVNLPMNRLAITYDENQVTAEQITTKIKKAGFEATLHLEADEKPKTQEVKSENTLNKEKYNLITSIILSIILLYISMGQMFFANLPIPDIISMTTHPINFAIIQMLLAITVMFIGKKFFINGFSSLFRGNPNMDSLVAISSISSFTYSLVMTFLLTDNPNNVHNLYFESAAIVLTLVSVGKYLEAQNKEKTKSAITQLMQLTPDTALLVTANSQKEVPTKDLKIGDIVLVKSGQSIPLDGEITEGTATINEAMLTGESMPLTKEIGDKVIGGTILTNGVIFIKITTLAHDSTVAKIIRFIEDAQGKKAPISKTADRVAGVFVPIVITIALISAIIWLLIGEEFAFAIKIFTSILVIACPCSMGLATPMSIIVGTGLGAKNGILIRSGEALETTHKVEVAIFDKTGTLTEGKPVVETIHSNVIPENDLLQLALTLETYSNHPLAKAICETAQNAGLTPLAEVIDFQDKAGKGIIANLNNDNIALGNANLMNELNINISNTPNETKTIIYVAKNQELLGYFTFNDKIKPDAPKTIKTLQNMGIKTIMLTGDNQKTADIIAKELGIDEVIADVLPEGKAKAVAEYQKSGKVVMMVGDGINDAPALVQADIGCAIGNGSDIAIDSAEIILMGKDLIDTTRAIDLSRKTIKNIKENLFWAFCYNVLCIPIAAGVLYPSTGLLLSPIIAGFAMSCSSLFVVSNALRLKTKNI